MRSTPVKISPKGRIMAGGPHRWQGVHVRDVYLLERGRRKISKMTLDQATGLELRRRRLRTRFASKTEAASILYGLNGEWFDSHDPGSADVVDLALMHGDRPGRHKLRREQLLETTGRWKGNTLWRKVLVAILPSSGLWEDILPRMEELYQAVRRTDPNVSPIVVPEQILGIAEVRQYFADLGIVTEAMESELVRRAAKGRMRGRTPADYELDADVPF